MGRQVRRIIVLAIICIAHLTISAYNIDENFNLSSFMKRIYNNENGLPQNTIEALLQTKDGFLWIGTQNGLVRFDGINFKTFNNTNTPAFKSNSVRAVIEDSRKRILIGTVAGLVVKKNNKFRAYGYEEGLSNEVITCLQEDKDGNIWVGTIDGVFLFKNDIFEKIHKNKNSGAKIITRIIVTKDNSIYAAVLREGLFVLKNNSYEPVLIDGYDSSYFVDAVAQTQGETLVSVRGKGIHRLEKTELSIVKRFDKIPKENKIQNMVFDNFNNLWINSYNRGLFVVSGNKSYQVDTTRGIISLLFDSYGSLWIGTEREGLIHHLIKSPAPAKILSFIDIRQINAVFEDSLENIWTSNEDGITVFMKDGSRLNYKTGEELDFKRVLVFFEDLDGKMWLGTSGKNPLKIIRNNKVVPFHIDNLVNTAITSIDKHKGLIAVGTLGKGVFIFDEEGVLQLNLNEELSSNFIRSLKYDKNGQLYMGTSGGGLNVLKDGDTLVYNSRNSSISGYITSIFFDSEDLLWVGTYGGGLNVVKNDKTALVDTGKGLPDNTVASIIQDNHDMLIVGSYKGLSLFRRGDLIDAAFGEDHRIANIVTLDSNDGLISKESYGGFQNTVIKRKNGNLLYATNDGLLEVNTKIALYPLSVPQVLVDKIIIDNVSKYLGEKIVMGAEEKRIKIIFTAPTSQYKRKIRYKYRLLPHETDWKMTHENKAVYTFLKPGEHRFELEAFFHEMNYHEKTKTAVAINKQPTLSERKSFKAAALILAMLLSASIIRFFLNNKIMSIKKENLELKEKNLNLEKRYAHNTINKEHLDSILKMMSYLMDTEKIYRDPMLSLASLASRLNCSEHNLSQILNLNLGVSFNNYINEYRVKEVVEKITDGEHNSKSIIEIAFESGFNTKTTFNSAFKKSTGKTPSQYKKDFFST